MIPTNNFFNVCKTAILKCRWLGEDAHRVHLALRELERLQGFAAGEREKKLPTTEYRPEAGDVEYQDPNEPEAPLDVSDDDFDDEDDEAFDEIS